MNNDDFIDMVLDYLKNALDSFTADPADSPYQEGYRAALVEFMVHIDHQMRVVVAKGESE